MTTMTAPTRRQKEAVTASPLYIQGDIGLNQPKVSDGKPAVMLVPVEASVDMPPPASSQPAFVQRILGDATRVSSVIPAKSVDLIVTSPPYWQKRDYGHADQLGQEATPAEYVQALIGAMRDWKKVLKNTGSIFLNVGDTYHKRSLVGIPGRIEAAAVDDGWIVRNRIIWAKTSGMPEPAKNRLASRHEYIIHLVLKPNYYYDLHGYSQKYGNGSNPGDIWYVGLERDTGGHLAPFPSEIVERAITLACPYSVCSHCGTPLEREWKRTAELDESRPQARRAMQLALEHGLGPEHIAAIQATGITDAGKAKSYQNGTGRNSEEVQRLAKHAKKVLGGYFREFTFAKRVTTGWKVCTCGQGEMVPSVVLDPFVGTGTTLDVAARLGHSAYGIDLNPAE
ncbi:hypothetical protein LGH70_22195 [Hymenobacter sp. BT635]|uniref:Methyltransferase n=2 Tax=Hymenobacter nitidus TaxID=2880929 RepID=A0ABS8AMV0_9BACT|nr:hypothetical protein [Hymenobacter nitidus]